MSDCDDLVEASRRALLKYYNSQTMTHGGYIIAIVIGFLTLISQWKAFTGSLISWNVIFFFIISLLVSLGTHLVGRIMYWGYLSNGVLRVKLGAKSEKTIMFQLHEKTEKNVRDNNPKIKYFRKLRLKITIGVTFTLWMFLNLLSYFLVETNMSLSIFQIFGLIWIIFLMILVIILSQPIRRKMKKISRFGNLSERGFVDKYYEGYLYILVIARYIFLFFAPTAFFSIVDFSVVLEHSLTLILVGLSFVIFVSTQLPHLMKAHILVTFTVDGKMYDSPIVFKSDEEEIFIQANVDNLGFSTYKNFVVIFYFGKEFVIVPYEKQKYRDLDFEKKFKIQKIQGGALFDPKDNFLTIPPYEVFIFPMYIKLPKKKKQGDIRVVFYSENTWGMVRINKGFVVKE